MPTLFQHFPAEPENALCDNAFAILCNAHDGASSFLDIFTNIRRARNAHGMPTDEEQDLLRAMLAFSSAGLDSLAKQLIRDTLPTVIKKDAGATGKFKGFVERRIRKGNDIDINFLADVIGDSRPRARLMQLLVKELTDRSLQSTEELLRAASFFDVPSSALTNDPPYLTEIFRTRNQIVHEMDIDFSQQNRSRRPRARDVMVEYTNEIFRISSALLAIIDRKLCE